MFRKSLTPLFTLLVLLSSLLFSQQGYAQAKCPDLNCTANDVQINSVFLGDANGNALTESCEPGTEQTAYLYIDFSTNAPRNGLYFSATLNGESLATCFSQLLTGSSTRVQYPTQIDYTCGETLTLTNIFLAYNPGQDNFCTENPSGDCSSIITSKCSRLPSVVVKAPLVADFTPLGSCPTTGQQAFETYTFSTNITGGTPNYSYTINYGDGNTATGTSTDGTETLTHTYTSGGSKTVTLTVTDAANRTDSHTETINVQPCCQIAVTCPTPEDSYNTDANECNATLSFEASVPQNCSGATIVYSIGNTPITFPYDFPIGSTIVTVTATDADDNTATCNFTVEVVDNQDPVITCPTPDALYNTDANDCNATLSFTAQATDNCSATPTVSYEVGGQSISFPYNFPVGTTTVTAIATDGAGNTASCTFDVVVADDVDPQITCPTPELNKSR